MVRRILKKQKIKKALLCILTIYNYMQLFSLTKAGNKNLLLLYYMINHIALPTRQHYFNFYNIIYKKSFNISSGVILKLAGHNIKFYKRSYSSNATLGLFFRQYYLGWWSHIYLLVINNFTYRQLTLYKKLNTLMKINIYYLLHNKSFIARFFPKRRIKRRVLRLLGFQ